MTVFDRIKSMSKDELQHLIYYIYMWGHINEQCGVDDEYFYEYLLDLPARHCDNIINALDHLQLYQICEICVDGGSSCYFDTKFFSVEDASRYLTEHIKHIVKADDTTYATITHVYRIITCK